MNYVTANSPLANSSTSSWGRKNGNPSLNILKSHQFTLAPVLCLLWALPVWMEKQQRSLHYVVYRSWRFCIALYFSKALSIEFLDTLAQVLQHELVEQNPCMPQICRMFCLWNQKQTFQEVSQKHLLLKTYVIDWKALPSLGLTLWLLDWVVGLYTAQASYETSKNGYVLEKETKLAPGASRGAWRVQACR